MRKGRDHLCSLSVVPEESAEIKLAGDVEGQESPTEGTLPGERGWDNHIRSSPSQNVLSGEGGNETENKR